MEEVAFELGSNRQVFDRFGRDGRQRNSQSELLSSLKFPSVFLTKECTRSLCVRAESKKEKKKNQGVVLFTIGFNTNLLVELLHTIIKRVPLSH